MADLSQNSLNTSTDTDSSVVFIGVSKNIKVEADVHAADQKDTNQKVLYLKHLKKKQLPKKKKILQNFSLPETEQSGK